MIGAIDLPAARPDFRALFLGAYGTIGGMGRARDEVGIALFAVDRMSGATAASVAISGRPGRVIGATVGRHDWADLRLVEDPWVANRQLAVLVHPLTSWEPDRLRYSILDLRTHRPMLGESGAPLASVVVEGPFFAQLGRYVLYVLPTGDPTDFPEDGRDAWAQLPERVVLEREAPQPNAANLYAARNVALDALAEAKPPRPRRDRRSAITSIGPLVKPDERLKLAHERCVAELTIATDGARATYAVGERALDRGILLGRYPRCDGAGVLALERVSRAHLLIKRIEGAVVALDTASTNGPTVEEPKLLAGPARVVPLGDRARLRLAKVADLTWIRR